MLRTLRPSRHLLRPGYTSLRSSAEARISALPEVVAQQALLTRLDSGDLSDFRTLTAVNETRPLDQHTWKMTMQAAMTTCALHVESRIASLLGRAFYTIGPCGEEALAPIGAALRPTDPAAFHYRHLSPLIYRHLASGRSLDSIILNRALGYTVAASDPVTGGGHCALGGGPADFIVTSTLASQAPPAVGRALALNLVPSLLRGTCHEPPFAPDSVSFVSLGDGSIANAHFLAATTLAHRAVHNKTKCPVLFCVSDNDLCISLRGNGFLASWLKTTSSYMKSFNADARNPLDVAAAATAAVAYVRGSGRPAILVVDKIVRRFGHAATDRQDAYMTKAEIAARAGVENSVIGPMVAQAVAAGFGSAAEWAAEYRRIAAIATDAFATADTEAKVNRELSERRLCAPLVPAGGMNGPIVAVGAAAAPTGAAAAVLPSHDAGVLPKTLAALSKHTVAGGASAAAVGAVPPAGVSVGTGDAVCEAEAWPSLFEMVAAAGDDARVGDDTKLARATKVPDCLRRNMQSVVREWLLSRKQTVYIGEDVVHGGYYTVTSGLAEEFGRLRVQDFPPDETTLLGAAQGMSQVGLEVCVEIPYAKYLDCGADMFTEIALTHWLACGRAPSAAGMIIRLQGFGQGVFGGNFHTTNTLTLLPGVDTVCFSNGADYAMGWRAAAAAARMGRIIMSVDSTHLLYHRDVYEEGDLLWETTFPAHPAALAAGTALGERGIFANDDVVCYYGGRAIGRRDAHHISAFEAPAAPAADAVLTATAAGVAAAQTAGREAATVVAGGGAAPKGATGDVAVAETLGAGTVAAPTKVVVVVTYGSGVVHSLVARSKTYAAAAKAGVAVVVVDTPYLTRAPAALHDVIARWNPGGVVFADVCKERFAPLLGHVSSLQSAGLLPSTWKLVGAANTYNPLGNVSTFLSPADVEREILAMIEKVGGAV